MKILLRRRTLLSGNNLVHKIGNNYSYTLVKFVWQAEDDAKKWLTNAEQGM